MRVLFFISMLVGLAGGPPALAQHVAGISLLPFCPTRAAEGSTVSCVAMIENLDDQHGLQDVAVADAVPGPSTITAPSCPSPSLGPNDNTAGGADEMMCTFDLTVRVTQCAVGRDANSVTYAVAGNSSDADPGAYGGLEVSASVSNRVFVDCCGDGSVDQPAETCDSDPPGSIPDDLPTECPTCPPGIANPCRARGVPGGCTLCGDGIVQAEAGEQCDDGNTIDGDACPNDCNTIPTTTTITTTMTIVTTTTTTTLPPSDDTGFIPPTEAVFECENAVAKAASKLAAAVIKCHSRTAKAAFASTPVGEEECEGRARLRFDRRTANLPGCPPCLDLAAIRDGVEAAVDRNNGRVYCDGTIPWP